ncbi:hypothetical protein AA101099_1088 [Neoasaia chiangmaiensis NBRC 101099]|uniref:DUF218 domain-containing protein n=1 Tax=Neoasaia chiangmaiensis TaxID=320497 RepID=A0A1U9KN88_9PROT|nr:YdcF family protein [Neoasaia chiangmaiensis]AQS87160.1 hypothetical protein A0U93_03535 [Neoasaia chiangmaiensis]GBR38192.1 hypothetical protein AA101099_1088 [Neoasaia chiangmaiensis NBRC 101099]GEN15996.1 hypothetical protein NCH01_24270 [Neoasaia chiangmaiensis]
MHYLIVFGAAPLPDGQPSEAMRRRVAAALHFGRHDPDIRFLLTGGIARRQRRSGPSEAAIMADLLVRDGIGRDRIDLEPMARDTFDSARYCGAFLRGIGYFGPLYICSSAYHLPRCRMLMRLSGWRTVAVKAAPASSGRIWRAWYWRLREVPAMMWDAMLMVHHRLNRVSISGDRQQD